jgi:penicillin-binding protein 1B
LKKVSNISKKVTKHTKKPRKKRSNGLVKKTKNRFILRFLLWFFPGLVIGLFVPWYFYLQLVVNSLFVDYHWSVPSSIYARELNLYDGKKININEVKYELDVLGYKRKSQPERIGEYSINLNRFEIFTKGFRFVDQVEKPKRVIFNLDKHIINGLNFPIVRLEPLLIGHFYSSQFENRQPIQLIRIPNTMVKGLQAIEDRNFKHHSGVDFFGIIRSLVKNIFAGKVVQGGSTITQQLIKNRLHYGAKSWVRKANEAVVAIMLEQKFDKGQILENYFNEIYWGQKGSIAIHGIKQASQYYFSKQPIQLSIPEQALLIGIIKGPSWYHPIRQKSRALKRRNTVLNVWYETSVINKKQWLQAKKTPLDVNLNKTFSEHKYKDFIDLVSIQLSQSFTKNNLNQEGLRIFTTVNPFVQNQMNKTLSTKTDSLEKGVQSAGVVSHAKTGEILAIKGAKNNISYFNRALLSKRQIGSLIKPFVYLAALEKMIDFDMNSLVDDSPLKIKTKQGEFWNPRNYDNKSFGTITAETALIKSRNQATVDLGLQLSVNKFVSFLENLGLSINRTNHPSVFLGATELTPLEVTNLYLILSSQTQQKQLLSIRHITDNNNELLGKPRKRNNLKLSESSVGVINSVLHKVTTQGTASKLTYKYGFKGLLGKTGTTNQGKNSWYVGYDHQYLATFWMGNDDNTPTALSGSSGALVLWADWYQNVFVD